MELDGNIWSDRNMNDNKQRSLARPWSGRSNGYPWRDKDFFIVDMPRLRSSLKDLCSASEKVEKIIHFLVLAIIIIAFS